MSSEPRECKLQLTLKNGNILVVKTPPLTPDFMQYIQKITIEAALEDPKEYEKLTPEEVLEAYVLIAQANSRYWVEDAQRRLQEAQRKMDVVKGVYVE